MPQNFTGDVAQVDPGVATLTTLWTADFPGLFKVTVCNRGAATAFRLSYAIAAAGDATTQYKFYDTAIGANETLEVTYAMKVGDRLRCYATLGTLSFSVNAVDER